MAGLFCDDPHCIGLHPLNSVKTRLVDHQRRLNVVFKVCRFHLCTVLLPFVILGTASALTKWYCKNTIVSIVSNKLI